MIAMNVLKLMQDAVEVETVIYSLGCELDVDDVKVDGEPIQIQAVKGINLEKSESVIEEYEASKWIKFDPTDKSTWPEPFTYVVTNLGVGMHRCLQDSEENLNRTYDHWSILEDNKDEATIFIGFMGEDDCELEVTEWQPIPTITED